MNILHVRLTKLTHSLCFRCGFWFSLPFKLALPPLLFLLYDGIKATPYDFDRCPSGGGLHLENPLIYNFSTQTLRYKIIAPCKMSQFENSPRITLKANVFQ